MTHGPLISLLHPTRRVVPSEGFVRAFMDALDAWRMTADHTQHVEYVLSVHESRWPELCLTIPDLVSVEDSVRHNPGAFGFHDFVVVKNTGPDTSVSNLNNAAKHATGQLFVGIQDDLYPPQHWDTLLLEALPFNAGTHDIFGQGEYIILCSSGATPERDRELMLCGALTRKRYERYGYALDPDFESMFADNWYAICARRDEAAGLVKIIERLDIKFEHRHPIFTGNALDSAYEQENREAAYRQGYATLAKKQHGTKVLATCFPGEQFRAEIKWANCDLLMWLNAGQRFLPLRFGGHTSNVYVTRMELAQAVLDASPKSDLVYWQDDDNTVSPQQFDMLYQDLMEHPKLDVVCGCCWCDNDGKPNADGSQKPWTLSFGKMGADLGRKLFTLEELQKAQESGDMLITADQMAPDIFWSGFPVVLMRAEVLRKLGAAAFRARTTDPEMLACLEASREFLIGEYGYADPLLARVDAAIKRAETIAACKWGQTSEDTSFFLACHEQGIKCAVDLRVKVPHGKFRAIEPQFIPERDRKEALKAKGEIAPQLVGAGI